MTTELEKQFFDTFEIKPKQDCWTCKHFSRTELCKVKKDNSIPCNVVYPQITDKHYLELICVLSTYMNEIDSIQLITAENTDILKEDILKELCTMIISKSFKHQVQAIFKGER